MFATIAIASFEENIFRPMLSRDIDCVVFDSESSDFYTVDGKFIDIDLVASAKPVILCASERAKVVFDSMIASKKIEQNMTFNTPIVLSFISNVRSSSMQDFFELLSAVFFRQSYISKLNCQYLKALKEQRELHEEMQRRFASIERYISNNFLHKRNECIKLIANRAISPIVLDRDSILEQRLPVVSSGLSDISIHIAEKSNLPVGNIHVSLVLIETRSKIAQWNIPFDEINLGWNRLSLLTPLDHDAQTVILVISTTGEGRITLSVSVKHPDERFQSSVDGNLTGYALALCTWTAIPGTEVPPTNDGLLPGEITAHRRVIPPEALRLAVDLNSDNSNFCWIEEESALQVHPIPHKIAIGMLPKSIRRGVSRVIARVRNANEISLPIDVALAVVKIKKDAKVDFNINAKFEIFSEWTCLHAGQSTDIILTIQLSLDNDHDLLFLSRMTDDADTVDFAWARFDHIRLIFDGH